VRYQTMARDAKETKAEDDGEDVRKKERREFDLSGKIYVRKS
jgi:hypothetical protein